VFATEASFEGEWQGLRVKGKIDRADRVKGRVVLYDYKGGKSAPKGVKDEKGQLKIDFQLPVYREVAVSALWPDLSPGAAYYLLVGSAEARSARIKSGALEDLALRLRGHLEGGRFPVDPDGGQDACKFCSLDLVCRRGPRLWRKEGAS